MNFPPGLTHLDLLLLALAVLVLPALSALNGRKLARDPDAPLIPRYWLTAARGWFVVLIVGIDWWITGRPLDWLGLDIPLGANGKIGLLLVGAAALFLGVVLLNTKRFVTPARQAKMRAQMAYIKILPRSTAELLVFLAVAVTAGIWEELLYRGFLIWFLGLYGGVAVAVVISTVVFGIGHIYQGWFGALNAGVIGLLFALAFMFSGSLWWLMAAHALIDLNGGLLAWRVLRLPPAEQPA